MNRPTSSSVPDLFKNDTNTSSVFMLETKNKVNKNKRLRVPKIDNKLKLLQRLKMKNIGEMVKDTGSKLKSKQIGKSNQFDGDFYLSAGNYELAKKFYMLALQSEITEDGASDKPGNIAHLMSGIGISTVILGDPLVGLAWMTDAKNAILEKSDIGYDDWVEIANIFEDMAYINFVGLNDKTKACHYIIEAIRIRKLLEDKFIEENTDDQSIPRLQYMMEIILENRKREIDIFKILSHNVSALGVRYPKILHMLSFLGKTYRDQCNDSLISLLYFEEALKLVRAANLLHHPCAKEVFKNILEIENEGVMRFKPKYVKHAT